MNHQQEEKQQKRKKEEVESQTQLLLLKTLEEILRNKILKKEEEVHRTKDIVENDRVCIEVNTFHWVIAQSLRPEENWKDMSGERYY
jgi:hypothetical protein